VRFGRRFAAGGRYLSDVWQLNLDALAWRDVTDCTVMGSQHDSEPLRFPATAAAVAVPYRGRILLVGGHVKENKKKPEVPLAVHMFDPARGSWSVLACGGSVPCTRGGHVACVIGDDLYLVGGEGPTRRSQDGVKVLDLTTCEWSDLELESSGKGPSPRSALVATAYQNRCVHVFIFCSVTKDDDRRSLISRPSSPRQCPSFCFALDLWQVRPHQVTFHSLGRT
jgi:hypothetical protein